MRRQVRWVNKLEDGSKRQVRVTVGAGKVKWQCKLANEEEWNYDMIPIMEDWDALDEVVGRRQKRQRGASEKDVIIIQKEREKAERMQKRRG